jgi:1,2-phenylacetyl-CoA epoxidase catalytic subunit
VALMAMPFWPVRGGARLTEQRRNAIARFLEGQGWRDLTAAHTLGAGVRLAPGLDEKAVLVEHIAHDLQQVERCAALYEDIGAGDLFAAVEDEVARARVPESYREVAMVELLFARATLCCVSAAAPSLDPALAELARKIAIYAEERAAAAEASLRSLDWTDAGEQLHVSAWLEAAVRSLGPPGRGRAGNTRIEPQDRAELVREYISGLVPVADACRLELPRWDSLTREAWLAKRSSS